MESSSRVLNGKTALVTGASRGIGAAIAVHLAGLGADVALAARSEEGLKAVAARVSETGRRTLVIPTDVTLPDQVARMVTTVVESWGVMDILVNNAGGTQKERLFGNFWNEDLEFIESLVKLNLTSVLYCSREAIPHMIRQGRGNIVNIGSSIGLTGDPEQTTYSTTKGGIHTLTRALARALAPQGIRVNCVVPGTVNTGGGGRSPESFAERVKRVPLGRGGNPEEVATVVGFLASDAAGFVTGQVVAVNGGQTMQ